MIPLSHRPAYAFAGGTLDRASEWREDEAAMRERFRGARILRVTPDARVAIADDRLQSIAAAGLPDDAFERASFLGMLDGEPWFAWPYDVAPCSSTTAGWTDLRTAAGLLGDDELAIAAYARALLHWQSRKRHCGRCGAPTVFDQAGHRARCSDEGCAQQYFPRTDPAIIVLVTHGDRCLLGRQPSWPEKRFSTLAGFVEPGETLEQAVAREVREESGVVVEATEYVASQPWPFPAALMIGFEARASDATIEVGAELAEACWFTPAQLRDESASGALKLSPKLSIAWHLIERWYRGQTGETMPAGPDWRAS